MRTEYFLTTLAQLFGFFLKNIIVLPDYPVVQLRETAINNLPTLLSILKKSSLFRFGMLTELTVCDAPELGSKRFKLILFLTSIEFNYRISVVIFIPQTLSFPSLSNVYSNSNWSEREVRDMFGIFFTNNNDLRRLLTDYGFEGFPLRKDFPLTGYLEARYDDELQHVLYEPVELAQEFRLFNLSSPWENASKKA